MKSFFENLNPTVGSDAVLPSLYSLLILLTKKNKITNFRVMRY